MTKTFNYLTEFDDLANEICIDAARVRPTGEIGDDLSSMLTVTTEELTEIIHRHLREQPTFQQRVADWMLKCFTPEIAADTLERNDRFLEEALELVQSIGYSKERAYALVDYVFGRPVGEPDQEAGGVMVTLAALCGPNNLHMHLAGEAELHRISQADVIAKIRAKQAAKPTGSALPVPLSTQQQDLARQVLLAVLDVTHVIENDQIVLRTAPDRAGNATAQLHDRIAAALRAASKPALDASDQPSDHLAAQRRHNKALSDNLRALAQGEEWWAGVRIQPMASAPSGADAQEPYELETHEGAWVVILDTNSKPLGWFDAHSAFTATRHRLPK